MQLYKGMFGSEFDHGPMTQGARDLFGISCGQIRGDDLVHNGGWYSKQGEKLGWGDLSPKDFPQIQKALESDQLFVILPESAAFWNFVPKVELVLGSEQKASPLMDEPGLRYLVDHAMYLITPAGLFYLSDHKDFEEPMIYGGITFQWISRRQLQSILMDISLQS